MIYNDQELRYRWNKSRLVWKLRNKKTLNKSQIKCLLFAAHENRTRFEHPSCPLERVHNHILKVIFHVPFGKHANKVRNRQYGLDVMREHTDTEFKNMVRLNRTTFNALLGKISKYLGHKNEVKARAASGGFGSSISARTKLYCTLRWLAGGNYHDIADLFGISRGSFFVDSIIFSAFNGLKTSFLK